MNFYRYSLNNRTHEFAKLIVSGDVARLHDIVDYFKERLNVPIQVLFSYSIDMESSEPDALVARIAVPIGLARVFTGRLLGSIVASTDAHLAAEVGIYRRVPVLLEEAGRP